MKGEDTQTSRKATSVGGSVTSNLPIITLRKRVEDGLLCILFNSNEKNKIVESPTEKTD